MQSRDSRLICASVVVLSTFLQACATKAEKPSPPPVLLETKCDRTTPLADPPAWPDDFLINGSGFALQLLGIIREDRKLVANEQKCRDDLRGKAPRSGN